MKSRTLALSIAALFLCSSNTFASSLVPTAIYSEDTIVEVVDYKDWHYYKIEVENPAKLTVKLRKLSDNADLYVSHKQKLSEDQYVCAPHKTGSSIETCRLTSHTPTTWYIGVHGKMQSDYQLNVRAVDLELISQINKF